MKKSGYYQKFLQEHERIKYALQHEAKENKDIANLKNSKEVYYEKLQDKSDIYRFYIKRPGFIIEKHKDKIPHFFYFRRGFKAYVDIRIKNDQVRFINKPRNALKNYNHPFVFDDNSICFGNSVSARKRWRNIGVRFDHNYNIEDVDTARKLALILGEARQVAEYGYIKMPIAVNKLFPPSLHFSEEYIGNDRSKAEKLKVEICENI